MWLLDNLPENVSVVFDTVFSIELEDTIHILMEKYRVAAKCLIGTDGVNSLVRRNLKIKPARRTLLSQVKLEFGEMLDSTLFIFDSRITPSYYSYLIPKNGFAFAGTKYEDRDSISRLLRYLRRLGFNFKPLNFESYPVTFIRSLDEVAYGKENVLLAGEAAGFVSPSSGEGTSFALESGILAARSAIKSLEADTCPCDVYKELCKPLIERLRTRIEKSKLIFNPELRVKYLGEVYGDRKSYCRI
jgi:flavin-dependent dehydrogenase